MDDESITDKPENLHVQVEVEVETTYIEAKSQLLNLIQTKMGAVQYTVMDKSKWTAEKK